MKKIKIHFIYNNLKYIKYNLKQISIIERHEITSKFVRVRHTINLLMKNHIWSLWHVICGGTTKSIEWRNHRDDFRVSPRAHHHDTYRSKRRIYGRLVSSNDSMRVLNVNGRTLTRFRERRWFYSGNTDNSTGSWLILLWILQPYNDRSYNRYFFNIETFAMCNLNK